ncbi:PadR family transcriptional regulator [Fulvivirgaceae bacterium PWU4]|uniref:PadR family transcriptional regulator n=1 Tax=Chryseosolibacter histidini TaxID=2782349 RepID=A0AAP2GSM3_9BACT|nr:PadR family transcriptional regulator [Chryseosolibacter histidini]MBT1701335.1 PadR family transcriptional regulator [Chryseosolibacter histidini]
MKGDYLGELEELVFLTISSLQQGDAYGVAIMNEIFEQTGREVNIGALHSVLKRLESKGYLKSKMGGATAERGGRRKRYFVVTPLGKKVTDEIISQKLQLYERVLGTTIKIL